MIIGVRKKVIVRMGLIIGMNFISLVSILFVICFVIVWVVNKFKVMV